MMTLESRWRLDALRVAALALAAVTVMAVGVRAEDDPPEPSDNGGSSDDFSADDETVGTLPSHGSDGGLELYRRLTIVRPSVCLEGRLSDLQNALLGVRGSAIASVELVTPTSDIVRVTLVGNVQVALDRSWIDAGDVRIGIAVPVAFDGAPSQSFFGRQLVSRTPLEQGFGALAIGVPSSVSARVVAGPLGARTFLDLRSGSEVVIVTQVFAR